MRRAAAIARAHGYFDSGEFLVDLRRRVAIPSTSQEPERASALRGYLEDEMVPSLAPLGFTSRILDNPLGPAFLVAERIEDADLLTVLIYGHGDTVRGLDDLWRGHDPRFSPDWSGAWWRDEHPLGIERVSHFTTIATDLDRARALYQDGLDGRVIHEEASADSESVFVFVGNETIVELARPVRSESLLGRDLEENGELPHAVTFKVHDLDAAERHVEKVGVGIVDRSGDMFTLDPADCFRAVYAFTDRVVPGDPRA
jgi:catechol 2,3-dioxygenase-like lactoylglutathione lyase family enzyme